MKKFKQILLLLLFLVLATYCTPDKTKVLVYNKANGFVHESIGPGNEAIKNLEKTYPFIVEVSDDSLIFRDSLLSNFDVILFMNTSGNILDEEGEAIRKAGHEFGATTGRPRRCGWLDLPALKYAIMM